MHGAMFPGERAVQNGEQVSGNGAVYDSIEGAEQNSSPGPGSVRARIDFTEAVIWPSFCFHITLREPRN